MNLGLIKYHLYSYTHSGKYLVPLLLYASWLLIAYNVAPVELLEMLGFTSLLNFFCMLITGVSFINHESTMIEMSFLARLKKKQHLYQSKLFVLSIYSLGFTILGMIFPIFANIINGFSLLARPVLFFDVAGAFLVLFLASLIGGFGGALLSILVGKGNIVGLITGESISIFIYILWVLIAIFRGSIILEINWLRWVLWVFPPIHELARSLIEMDGFQLSNIWVYLLYGLLYTGVLAVAYVKIMMVKKVA